MIVSGSAPGRNAKASQQAHATLEERGAQTHSMRRATLLLIMLSALNVGLLVYYWIDHRGAEENPARRTLWSVYFSPRGAATDAVVKALDSAQAAILVQAYSFTSAPIARALVDAHRRGVKVQVILDKSQRTEKYSSADFLAHAGIPTMIDAVHAIAHNKIMIVDGAIVLTGSFNFTKAAEENNAENLIEIRDKEVADRYTENWRTHRDHAEPYAGR